jgi:hypothetical integral membrane protein (TIGR02206 family)
VGLAAVGCTVLCVVARRRPGRWRVRVAEAIGVALAADAVAYTIGLVVEKTWSPSTSLPLALCNAAVPLAAVACWWRRPLLVELTWFLGLAGTLQAVVTPDLDVGFPHLVFFEYLVGHLGIVLAALFLVVGMDLRPRAGSVGRVFAITALYTAFVGLVDGMTGANYMFLRRPPKEWTLLRLLGPWPWYVVSAAGVGLVLLVLLDLPFRHHRRPQGEEEAGRPAPGGRRPTPGGRRPTPADDREACESPDDRQVRSEGGAARS